MTPRHQLVPFLKPWNILNVTCDPFQGHGLCIGQLHDVGILGSNPTSHSSSSLACWGHCDHLWGATTPASCALELEDTFEAAVF